MGEPSIGEVVAVEVEAGEEDRRYTRDPGAVKAVLDAIGPADRWERSGMPRCRPRIWARLVPPDGEGGASFLFCGEGGTGHLSVPGEGSFALGEQASAALYAATTALALPEVGSIPPTAVSDNLASLMLVVNVAPGADAPQGLRSVALYLDQRLEPDATWADGSPVTQSFQLTEDQARGIVWALALSGFFHRSQKYYGPYTATTTEPPPNAEVGPPPAPEAPAGWVALTVTAGDWYVTWNEASGAAIFEHTLHALEMAGPGDEALAAFGALRGQLD